MNTNSRPILRWVFNGAALLLIVACSNPMGGGAPSGQTTITGTYEFHSDVTSDSSTSGFAHTKIDMVATFTATANPDNSMDGTAQVTYVESYEIGGKSCSTSWTTGDITWTPGLRGTLQKNKDGSLTVGLLADPKEGPSFSKDYLCLGEIPTTPSFAGVSGTLVNGVYDIRRDIPVGPNATGTTYETTHMEIAPAP